MVAESIYVYRPELSNMSPDQTLGQFPALGSNKSNDGFGSKGDIEAILALPEHCRYKSSPVVLSHALASTGAPR